MSSPSFVELFGKLREKVSHAGTPTAALTTATLAKVEIQSSSDLQSEVSNDVATKLPVIAPRARRRKPEAALSDSGIHAETASGKQAEGSIVDATPGGSSG
jgi:hypothetical protein